MPDDAICARCDEHHECGDLAKTTRRRREAIDGSDYGYWVIDCQGRLLDINDTYARQSGFPRSELLRMTIMDLDACDDLGALRCHLETIRRIGHGVFDTVHRRKDGSLWPVHVAAFADPRHGANIFVFLTDLTERNREKEAQRIAAVVFESGEATVVTDADQKILQVNRQFTQITGYAAAEVIGKTPKMLQSGRHDDAFYASMWQSILGMGQWRGEVWDRRKNGEIYPKWLTVSAVKDQDGNTTHYIGSFQDVSERKKNEARIRELAFHDQLTGLANRALLFDRLTNMISMSARAEEYLAVILIDLDQFKMLNDTRGHDVGDRLLKTIASRLRASVRACDVVARLGGDEFVVGMTTSAAERNNARTQAAAVCEKIRRAITDPVELEGAPFCTTASIGVSLFQGGRITMDDALKQADLAMYRAKSAGRNAVRFFSPEMEAKITQRVRLETELREAIDREQFVLHYQLQFDTNDKPIGAEALLRWRHPDRGLIPPSEFIPLAEEIGLISRIGRLALRSACAQLAAWAANPVTEFLTISVNVSAKEFHEEEFVDHVLVTLAESSANPARLEIELTEGAMAHDVESLVLKMRSLHERGVRFSLDDFGTGYSSLMLLKRLPISRIKIDQSFVRDILVDESNAALVKSILSLGRALDVNVIAEGVETPEQRDFLARSGCRNFQGFYFSRPEEIESVETMLIRRSIPYSADDVQGR